MQHEDGYCDTCGAELTDVAWLTFDGRENCGPCATSELNGAVRVARKPEARDDGR
jgi:hypothetical protein